MKPSKPSLISYLKSSTAVVRRPRPPKKSVEPVTLLSLNTRTGPPKPKVRKAARPTKSQVALRTWICIHLPKKMRRSAGRTAPGKVETGKMNLRQDALIGDRVWLVGKSADETRYHLYGHFIVDSTSFGVSSADGSTPKLIISGAECTRFRTPIPLENASWWRLYAKKFQGRSHGFQCVKAPVILAALDRILKQPAL